MIPHGIPHGIPHVKAIAVGCIFSLILFSSGCLGIQAPIIGSMPKMDIAIQPVPNQFHEKPAYTPTPVVNVTVTQTTKPRFVYV